MMRFGIGYDSHRFVVGRPLRLAGQVIPHSHGLAGHSDADAVAHAVTDAMLGAAALGDIGRHFPDTDPRWAGADSLELLRQAAGLLREAGFRMAQTDVTIILEQPKLAPYIDAMCRALAASLDISPDHVSIKAKTNEGMGFLGRGEGIACLAVASVEGP